MFKKTAFIIALSMMAVSILPSTGMCWSSGYHGGSGRHYGGHGGYYGGGYNRGYGGYYNNNAWAWGLGGLVVGSALTAAVLYQPPPPQVVYAYPPPQQVVYAAPPQQVMYAPQQTAVYTNKPSIPPGKCRWERTVLDNYGRAVLDQYGNPVLEYTIGECNFPPN